MIGRAARLPHPASAPRRKLGMPEANCSWLSLIPGINLTEESMWPKVNALSKGSLHMVTCPVGDIKDTAAPEFPAWLALL
jgi:hypothetical protein